VAPDHRATARPDEQKRPYTEGLRFIRSSWSRLDVRQIAGCGRPAGEHKTKASGPGTALYFKPRETSCA